MRLCIQRLKLQTSIILRIQQQNTNILEVRNVSSNITYKTLVMKRTRQRNQTGGWGTLARNRKCPWLCPGHRPEMSDLFGALVPGLVSCYLSSFLHIWPESYTYLRGRGTGHLEGGTLNWVAHLPPPWASTRKRLAPSMTWLLRTSLGGFLSLKLPAVYQWTTDLGGFTDHWAFRTLVPFSPYLALTLKLYCLPEIRLL